MKSDHQPFAKTMLFIAFICLSFSTIKGQSQQTPSKNKILLGELSSGEKVYASQQSSATEWGIFVINKAGLQTAVQQQPLNLQFYQNDNNITDFQASYKSVSKTSTGFLCGGEISPVKGLVFKFKDTWTIDGKNLSMNRKVIVSGKSEGGFSTGISLLLRKDYAFPDVRLFAPGMSYGTPDYLSTRAPGGPTVSS